MSSAGHMADMQTRLKANRDLLKKRAHFGENEKGLLYFGTHRLLRFKKGSKKDMDKIKDQIDLDLKRQKRFELIMLIIAIVTFATAFSFFVDNFV